METTVTDTLIEAAVLMLVGMTVVFVFLVILIGAVKLIAWLDSILPAVKEPTVSSRSRSPQKNQKTPGTSPALIAAISAAVHQYRNTK